MSRVSRRYWRKHGHAMAVTGALLTAAALSACQDKRVQELNAGIPRDSVMSILAQNIKKRGPDAYPNVYKRAEYLIGGKNLEVLYFTPDDEKIGESKDTIPLRKLTPIVILEGKMIGKGWDFWDSTAAANKVPVPPKK